MFTGFKQYVSPGEELNFCVYHWELNFLGWSVSMLLNRNDMIGILSCLAHHFKRLVSNSYTMFLGCKNGLNM